MATKKELEIQIEALRKFLTDQRAKWEELNPQEQAHYEFVEERLHNLEQEKSRIDEIERQPEFKGKQVLRGIGNLALNFLPQLKIFKGLRGPKGNQQGLPSPFYEGEYEILGEGDLPSTEGILSLPAGPPVPEGHIPINLPAIETPPPVDFDQPVMGPEATVDNFQNYLRWQDKMIKELPENATTEQFVNNQAEFLEMHTRGLQERFNLNPSQVRRIKTSFEDHIGGHWSMFDPSIPENTPATIGTRLAELIEGTAETLVKQAAHTGIGSLADVRFEAVATDPDYAIDNATQQPLVPDAVFTKEIDPIFLSTSPLRQFLAGRKKGDLDPATVLDELGIELIDTGIGFKNKTTMNWKEYGKDPDNPVKKWGARVQDNRGFNTQAIDSGVANLLRNRMRSGEIVTKQELIRVLDHHRGQFSTEITFGNDTSHGNQGFSNLLRVAESGLDPYWSPRDDIDSPPFEIASKYRPVLEEGGRLGSSPFSLKTGSRHNWASDATGDQHFWLRGEVLEYADGLKGGSVAEIQSDMGWADSPLHEDYAWLSDIITPESEEITDIQKRQELFEEVYDDAKVTGTMEADAVRDISSGRLPLTYNANTSWIEPVGRAISEMFPGDKFAKEFKELHDSAKEFAIGGARHRRFSNPILKEQPFAREFGIELTKEDVDIPLSDIVAPWVPGKPSSVGLGEALDFAGGYARALRSRLLEKYPHDFGDIPPAFQNGMTEVDQLMLKEYEYAMDGYTADFYGLFTEEALSPLFENRPELGELYAVGQNAPTEAEMKKLTEFQDQQAGTTALADFPMKKTYPRYGARSLIQKGLAHGWDTVEIANLPPGQGGATENYNKATKELAKIATKFNLPIVTRSATMEAGTGEEGGGTAQRLVTFFRLDIRPLRALIEAEEFEGFIGMKHGGLVTKAQGAGYNMNYGDYGRSYT